MTQIITIAKGTPYSQGEMDVRAILNTKHGDPILDKDNCFKYDTEIHFIRKINQR